MKKIVESLEQCTKDAPYFKERFGLEKDLGIFVLSSLWVSLSLDSSLTRYWLVT